MILKDPPHLRVARALLGTREVAGAGNNPTILAWALALGIKILGISYTNDSTAWCGLFIAHCLRVAGVDLAKMKIGVRATAWASWGVPLEKDELAPGAILVFLRPQGGHVAFYLGEDATHYHILGGNQGDKVSIVRKLKSECIARRWPADVPRRGKPVLMAAVGVPVAGSEA